MESKWLSAEGANQTNPPVASTAYFLLLSKAGFLAHGVAVGREQPQTSPTVNTVGHEIPREMHRKANAVGW